MTVRGMPGFIDVVAEAIAVSAWLERTYAGAGRPTVWFWGVGLGLAWIDVPDAAGPLQESGTFDIRT